MKHTRLTGVFSLLVTLAFILTLLPAPAAFAYSESFVAGCQVNGVDVHYSPSDSSKVYATLTRGERIEVRDTVMSSGVKYYRVYVQNNISEYSDSVTLGFLKASSGAIPSNVPTDTFVGESTTNKSCLLYSCAGEGLNLETLTMGAKLKVIQQVGDFYLVFHAPQTYGYVKTSDCSAYSITAPTVTPAPTTTTGKASSAAVGFDDLNVASKGKLAPMAKLYGINKLAETSVIAQTPNGGDAQVYYRVPNDFYLVSTGEGYGFYAYVPCQSVTVYDMAAVPHIAGTMNAISGISNGQTIVSTGGGSTTSATIGNCTSWVSMRAKASSSSKRLYKLNKGKSVTVLGTEGSYTKVQYDGTTGYVLSTYVK